MCTLVATESPSSEEGTTLVTPFSAAPVQPWPPIVAAVATPSTPSSATIALSEPSETNRMTTISPTSIGT